MGMRGFVARTADTHLSLIAFLAILIVISQKPWFFE
jgi:hypothetical protein